MADRDRGWTKKFLLCTPEKLVKQSADPVSRSALEFKISHSDFAGMERNPALLKAILAKMDQIIEVNSLALNKWRDTLLVP